MEFEIVRKEISEKREKFNTKEISAQEKLNFAIKIMIGLFCSFIIVVSFLAYSKDIYSKHVFNASMQLINTFGSFIMGFYFSRK